jgi:hypothetical protein
MMRSLRSALALLLAAGLAGCAYGGGGSPYGYQQANAYPGYGYSTGPSVGLGFGSYGGYPSYYYPNYPNWHHQGNWHRPPPGGYPGNGHKPPPGDGHGWPPPNAGGGSSLKPPIFGSKSANGGGVVAGGNRPPLRPRTTNPLCKDCDS